MLFEFYDKRVKPCFKNLTVKYRFLLLKSSTLELTIAKRISIHHRKGSEPSLKMGFQYQKNSPYLTEVQLGAKLSSGHSILVLIFWDKMRVFNVLYL